MSGSNTSATGGFVTNIAPPVSPRAFEDVFQQMVVALAGLPGNLVRPRWQPMPPVQPPVDVDWAGVGVVSTEGDEFPYIQHVGATDTTPAYDIMRRQLTVTGLISFYGPQAETHAAQVRDALYIPQNSEPFSLLLQAKIYSVDELGRNPELVNQQWLNRADLRIILRQQIDRIYPILDIVGANVGLIADSGSREIVTLPLPPPTQPPDVIPPTMDFSDKENSGYVALMTGF